MKSEYIAPQETWDYDKCLKMSKVIRRDGNGTPWPYRGLINSSGSSYPEYGQTVRFNGGFIAPDGEHYKSHTVPLPKIHKDFEFYQIISWGLQIRKKK